MPRRLAAIIFTDIVEFTALSQADEPAALRLLQEQDTLVRPTLELHHGRKVKSIGDGLLIEFPNVLDATEFAVELQRKVEERNAGPATPRFRLRVGIHLGDVQRRGTDILGDAVNIASRVVPLADPGGICLSQPVYAQVRNKVAYQFEELGPKSLKGVREPMEIYRVVLPWVAPEASTEPSSQVRLAVLPLTNFSPNPEDGYFADGLTEEIISTVSKIRQLGVISRTSVMRYKNQSKSIGEIGRELGAGSILEGSVRKAGNRIRVAVQLIDAARDKHLWAEQYDRGLEDIFAIQSEMAEKIARELKLHLLEEDRERIERPSTEVTEAHLLYLKGVVHQQHIAKDELLKAIECYKEATRRDPRYALAFAGMSWCYGVLDFNEMLPLEAARPNAIEAAKRALELDDSLAEAHLGLSQVLLNSWDVAGALREARRALDLAPNLAHAHSLAAWVHLCRREFTEAENEAENALQLDPLSAESLDFAGVVYLYSGAPGKAVELCERATKIDPTNRFALQNLGFSQVIQGRYEEGIAGIRKAIALVGTPDFGQLSDLAYAYARAGRIEEAREVLASILRRHEDLGRGAFYVASGYASVGDREKSFEWLEKAYHERSSHLIASLLDPAFAELSSDPRFRDLRNRMTPDRSISEGSRTP